MDHRKILNDARLERTSATTANYTLVCLRASLRSQIVILMYPAIVMWPSGRNTTAGQADHGIEATSPGRSSWVRRSVSSDLGPGRRSPEWGIDLRNGRSYLLPSRRVRPSPTLARESVGRTTAASNAACSISNSSRAPYSVVSAASSVAPVLLPYHPKTLRKMPNHDAVRANA